MNWLNINCNQDYLNVYVDLTDIVSCTDIYELIEYKAKSRLFKCIVCFNWYTIELYLHLLTDENKAQSR